MSSELASDQTTRAKLRALESQKLRWDSIVLQKTQVFTDAARQLRAAESPIQKAALKAQQWHGSRKDSGPGSDALAHTAKEEPVDAAKDEPVNAVKDEPVVNAKEEPVADSKERTVDDTNEKPVKPEDN
ncbi:MAG: hypothetical protein L6R37_006274 [Teloschistes peruensis]|nr:MAG: hypothetical protein L6R37_006274 [Teloschistes peruensis]